MANDGTVPHRLLLFEGGQAIGCFSQSGIYRPGVVEAVILEPFGGCFTHIDKDGRTRHQLTQFCVHQVLPKVSAVVKFRNLFSLQPYVCSRINFPPAASAGEEAPIPVGQKGRISRFAVWPARPHERHCRVRGDGSIEVRAIGGNARIVLLPLLTWVEVDFATACSFHNDKAIGKNSRVWITQRHMVASAPAEFTHAIGLALNIARYGFGWGSESTGDNHVTASLPLPTAQPEHPRWDSIPVPSLSPFPYPPTRYPFSSLKDEHDRGGERRRGEDSHGKLLPVEALSLGLGCGFLGTLPVIVEEVDDCTYAIVKGTKENWGGCVGDGGIQEQGQKLVHVKVQVTLHADGSEILLSGDFIRLRRPSSRPVIIPDKIPGTSVSASDGPGFDGLARAPTHTSDVEERLLHVSAASTYRLWVPTLSTSGRLKESNIGSKGKDFGEGKVVGGESVMKEISLGDIAAHACEFRRQYNDLWQGSVSEDNNNSSMFNLHGSAQDCELTPGKIDFGVGSRPWLESGTTTMLASAGYSAGLPLHPQSLHSYLPVSAEVVERAQAGGASFVAFTDGRVSAVFADRTIVGMGPPLRKENQGCDLYSENIGFVGDHLGGSNTEKCNDYSLRYKRGYQAWREESHNTFRCCDCVLPDATQVRVSVEHPGPVLAPYIRAVRHFAVWAFTDPITRTESSSALWMGRVSAVAEAHRNRIFVTGRRVARMEFGKVGLGGVGGYGRGALVGDLCRDEKAVSKEICGYGYQDCGKEHIVGIGQTPAERLRLRNDMVRHVVEANRCHLLKGRAHVGPK